MSGTSPDWTGPFDPDGLWDWIQEQLEQRLRELGTRTPRCRVESCHETHPFALTGIHPEIICYEHRLEQLGRRSTEEHHWFGRHNDPFTTAIPGNDHRFLSTLQARWPGETLRNPHGSPVLKAAAALRSWLDLLWVLIHRLVGWIPAFLEWLDGALSAHIGERWWEELGWTEQ
jgi:hypothetical protein